MAKLTELTLNAIFELLRQLIPQIDAAADTELKLFDRFGETEETLIELEELQNIRERLRNPYSRLSALLLQIAEYQPIAPTATLDLLIQTISLGQANVDAAAANIQEIKKSWNL